MVMRTRWTLEDDDSARLREQVAKTGDSLEETVSQRFKVEARDLGGGHVDFDKVGEVLERFEGPDHR
jgi:hypothetical protein